MKREGEGHKKCVYYVCMHECDVNVEKNRCGKSENSQ